MFYLQQKPSLTRLKTIWSRCSIDWRMPMWLLHRFSSWQYSLLDDHVAIWLLDSTGLHVHWIIAKNFENILLSHTIATPYGFKMDLIVSFARKRYFSIVIHFTWVVVCCWQWWSIWLCLDAMSSRFVYIPSKICRISWPTPNEHWWTLKPFSVAHHRKRKEKKSKEISFNWYITSLW